MTKREIFLILHNRKVTRIGLDPEIARAFPHIKPQMSVDDLRLLLRPLGDKAETGLHVVVSDHLEGLAALRPASAV